MLQPKLHTQLYSLAVEAMKKAYNPYSSYSVGAALITEEKQITSGCNVENVSFRLTLCAEANAVGSLVAQHGKQTISDLLLVASGPDFPSPCGACRQIIAEFSRPETMIHLARSTGLEDTFEVRSYRISALLPLSFSRAALQNEKVKQVSQEQEKATLLL